MGEKCLRPAFDFQRFGPWRLFGEEGPDGLAARLSASHSLAPLGRPGRCGAGGDRSAIPLPGSGSGGAGKRAEREKEECRMRLQAPRLREGEASGARGIPTGRIVARNVLCTSNLSGIERSGLLGRDLRMYHLYHFLDGDGSGNLAANFRSPAIEIATGNLTAAIRPDVSLPALRLAINKKKP